MKKYVLDTSAILNFFLEGEIYCPPEVWKEVRKYRNSLGKVYYSFYKLKLKIMRPSQESIKKVEEAAKSTGDIYRLSETDKKVIALALDLEAIVVTNDTSIQNICEVLGIPYLEFGGKRIKKVFRWRLRCTSCGRYFDKYYPECPYCGGKLKTVLDRKGKDEKGEGS